MAWQTIETASLEGDEILIARKVRETVSGDIWVMHVAWYDARAARWRSLAAESLVHPTHWMPLPEPPK